MEITKERVIEAANKCPQAKETLKTLFPECFEDDKYFDLVKINFGNYHVRYLEGLMCVRKDGELKGKAFRLSKNHNWELKMDSEGKLCLIPTKK